MTQVGIEPTSMWISPINITIYNNDYSVDQINKFIKCYNIYNT